ncbi:MAG: polyprenyl synthetase family protein, partial [Chloroflexota bacterium]|nr:polyprenyl synthetase family protein [Chloroflexota bacterium]
MSISTVAIDLDACMPLVRDEMLAVLATVAGGPEGFYAAMRYAVGLADEQLRAAEQGGGKLLRPRLVVLSCVAAGGDFARAIPVAAAVELLHNFTLVHDDIQDNSPQRRHRPALWNLMGTPLAINAGDAMYASSHLVLSSLARRGGDPALVLHALEEFDQTAITLCEGQHMDISFESRAAVSSDEYLAMIERKTGALMGLSCYLGALVADTPPAVRQEYRRFGLAAGMGYQILDDLAGVWQDEAHTGKR